MGKVLKQTRRAFFFFLLFSQVFLTFFGVSLSLPKFKQCLVRNFGALLFHKGVLLMCNFRRIVERLRVKPQAWNTSYKIIWKHSVHSSKVTENIVKLFPT